jgi:hypothetical protein
MMGCDAYRTARKRLTDFARIAPEMKHGLDATAGQSDRTSLLCVNHLMELNMKSITHAVKSATLSAATAALLAGATAPAKASNTGSTDIYRDEFQTSFDFASQNNAPHASEKAWIGSTDIYAAQFQRLFGNSQLGPREVSYARGNTGSTDIWGRNGFQRSFGTAS